MLTVSVVVPTYRRTELLQACLTALGRQRRRPDQVLVVARDTDERTLAYLAGYEQSELPLEVVKVTVPGMVAAMNAGLAASWGEIIAFTDDDAAPRQEWIERLGAHFEEDSTVGAVGGRDWVVGLESVPPCHDVGRVQWFGRMIGNHHRGIGPPRDVDLLKGVNMSFRRAALNGMGFDTRLRGSGAQVHNEVSPCLTLKRRGWRVVYDPAVAVDHATAPRLPGDERDSFATKAVRESVHNETLALLDNLPPGRRLVFLIWAVLVGTAVAPGGVQYLRFLVQRKPASFRRLVASYAGRLDALRTWWGAA